MDSAVPFGIRSCFIQRTVETVGYFQMSLRDKFTRAVFSWPRRRKVWKESTLDSRFRQEYRRAMKSLGALLLLLPILLFSSCATPSNQQVSNSGIIAGVSAPQTLKLMGDSYAAKYSARSATQAIVEYYRSGESPKSWKRMLALRLNVAEPNSLQQVKSMEHSIRTKGSSAVRVYHDKNTDGYGIEFIATVHGYQELDVFRYVNRTNGPGTVSFQYAEIIPQQELFAKGDESKRIEYLVSLRLKAVKAMESAPMPTIEKLP